MSNPLDWHGPAFLLLYLTLFLVALVMALILPRHIRPSGRFGAALDDDALAFLTGQGPPRMLEAAVARLLASGTLVIEDGKRFLRGDDAGGHGALDCALLAVPMPANWGELARAAIPHVAPVERRLMASGLWMDKSEIRRIGLIAALPFIGLFGLGIAKLLVGLSRDKPVGFLTAFLVVTAIATLIRIFSVDRRTDAGIEALAAARRRHERLKRAPTTVETGTAVALFGTTVLAGSAFAALHQMRVQTDGGSSGDSGGSSGGDGGGCGGGGCGGCGGG